MPPEPLWTVLEWAFTGAALSLAIHTFGTHTNEPRLQTNAKESIITFVLFGLLAQRRDNDLDLAAFSFLALIGVRLTVIDLTEHQLPRSLVMPLYPTLWGLLGLATAIEEHHHADLLRATIGMIALPTAYLTLAIITRNGLGSGDIRLAGPIGLSLAWHSWNAVLTGTLLTLIYASLTATIMLTTRNATRHTPIPFGPAMLGGTFIAILTH
ncbi:prepilin peptidase [Actinophytocola sediminis]